MKITIMGCGAFGTAIAYMFKENNCKIRMWNKFDNGFDELKEKMPFTSFYTDMNECIDNDSVIVIAIPIEYMEDVIIDLSKIYNNQNILVVSKGIEANNGLFASNVIEKNIDTENYGIISGGTFASDMKSKSIMGLTLATKSDNIKDIVMNNLDNKYLNIEYTDDVIGVQICGAIKNVMAIGFGILDGANYSYSSKYLFLTEAIYEIKNIIKYLNGNDETIISYAGIDDIMMTCTSSESRNYTFGRLIGEKADKNVIDKYKKDNTVEGITSVLGFKKMLGNSFYNFKICSLIYDILYNNESYDELINILIHKKN